MKIALLSASLAFLFVAGCSSDSTPDDQAASNGGGASGSSSSQAGAGGKALGAAGKGGSAGSLGTGGNGASGKAATGGASGHTGGTGGSGTAGKGNASGAGGAGAAAGTATAGNAGSSGNSASGNGGQAGSSDEGACAANTVRNCTCTPAASTSTQQCLADGSAWGQCSCVTYGKELAVAPTGDDSAAGTLQAPWKTLGHAQTEVQKLIAQGLPAGGVVVWLRGGTYPLTATLALTSKDSGTATAPVVYRGYPGETARLTGGQTLDASTFQTVTSSSPIWSRLDPTAQGMLVSVDLTAFGITDLGTLMKRGYGSGTPSALELFVDGAREPLGRWPDADRNDPGIPDVNAAQVTLYPGIPAPSPDVTGEYDMTSMQDGVSAFTREGLVNGKQYTLHRAHGSNNGSPWVAWFVTTTVSGYPAQGDPFYFIYQDTFGSMAGAQGATGQLSFLSPTSVSDGFSKIASASADQLSFTMAENRASRWGAASDVWIHAYFGQTWADEHLPATKIDGSTGTITLPEVPLYGLDPSQSGGPFYAYNLPEEITEPGEWWVDRSSGILYLWPPADGLVHHEVTVSLLAKPLVSMNGVNNVTWQELTFAAVRDHLLTIEQGQNDQLVGCTFLDAGTDAVTIDGGTGHSVVGAWIHDTGGGGVRLNGGDRPSLTQANHSVKNSNIHRFGQWNWTYSPAIDISGDGISASHNLLHDAPHAAILYGGSQHTIELNEIHDVCTFGSDEGAIYAGRDWGARGIVIQHNYIHDIVSPLPGGGAHGIYLDDCLSGVTVYGNVLYKIASFGLMHGGGRDDLMTNNLIARCGAALHTDDRGVTAINDTPGDSWNFLEKLEAVNYQQDLWASAFPACAAIPDSWATISAPGSTWREPEGSTFVKNVGFANTNWTEGGDPVLAHFADTSNDTQFSGTADQLFVDEAAGDLTVISPSTLVTGGFDPIPFSTIGIKP